MNQNQVQPIIKKIKKASHGGHHGGSWKIAYADFVTAMMAFFLLMWLVNATSEEQKRGLANYFDPISVGSKNGGSMGVMGGMSIKDSQGRMDESSSRITLKPTPPTEKGQGGESIGHSQSNDPTAQKSGGLTEEEKQKIEAEADLNSRLIKVKNYETPGQEKEAFQNVTQKLKQSLEKIPELKELHENVIIEETEEGLRIQIVDQMKRSMFPSGSSRMYLQMQELLMQVALAIKDVPNKIKITGHTDATPYSPNSIFSNWELSTERANASRRVLNDGGVTETRIVSVSGTADRELLNKEEPQSPQNRRIAIVLLKEAKSS